MGRFRAADAHPMTRPALALGIPLLLLLFAARLALVNAVPPFIDEGIHLQFALEQAQQRSPFVGAPSGKLVADWYWLALGAPYGASFWVMRVGNLLVITLGAAALMGIGRHFAGAWGMVLAPLALLLSPYHTFLSGIAITDPLAVGYALVGVWLTFGLTRRAVGWQAALAGLMFFLAAGSKVAYLVYGAVPIIGALTLRPRWRRAWLWALLATVTFALLYGGFAGVQMWRGYGPLAQIGRGVALGDDASVWAALMEIVGRIIRRNNTIMGVYFHYTGRVAGVAALLLAGVHLLRRNFFLPLVLAGPGLSVWATQMYFDRYAYLPLLLVLLMAALTLAEWARRLRWGAVTAAAATLAWGVLWSLPFMLALHTDPASVPLTATDHAEYLAADSAGTAIAEAVAYLTAQDAQHVIGLLPNCTGLKFSAHHLRVDCPRINPNGEDIPTLAALVTESAAPGVYVVKENSPYVPQQITGTPVLTLQRPGGLTTLTIYDLSKH